MENVLGFMESIMLMKMEGGLGYRDLSTFNQSMLEKLGWKILSQPQGFMAQIIHAKYLCSA